MNSRGGHGTVDLRRAIAESCDVYFYTVADKVAWTRSTSGRRRSGLA